MDIYKLLANIVGKRYVSNNPAELFIYSRDSGAQSPRIVDYVVLPKTTEEVRQVLILANEKKIPVTPLGGGMSLSALVVPTRGGIVLDMKRMDQILEINEINRYALIEAGVSQGSLKTHLEKRHPRLQHSIPEAPPTVTVVGNVLIQGHGHISPRYGINSDMINGMEIVLPTGDICKIGSPSVGPYWFTRGPLPDLPGLFIGWFGTTGVVTKLSIKLYPKPRYREVITFVTDDIDIIPEAIFETTQVDLLEDFFLISQGKPVWMNRVFFVIIVAGHSEEELEFKKNAYKNVFREIQGGKVVTFVDDLHPALRDRFLAVPPLAALAADFKKGGGFEYTGSIIPIDKVSEAWRKGMEIARKYDMVYSYVHQILGGHSIMFSYNYSFNRADAEDAERTRQALEESNKLTLDIGGMIWKGGVNAQRMTMDKMDAGTVELIRKIKSALDPNGIMNPGNWEVV
ncbi:MAG TPA: FAD-binding oxidoreductase [Deltaproteobacteria bacterium]|nr:FAD-binding oxidoreductase [Deltaproteobacteria bacterium]